MKGRHLLLVCFVTIVSCGAQPAAAESERLFHDAGLFFPFFEGPGSIHYADLRMHSSHLPIEASLGVGHRRLLPDNERIVGAYAYLDRSQSESGRAWTQWTLGAELLAGSYDVRLNAYLPERSKKLVVSVPDDEVVVDGSELVYVQTDVNTYEEALAGIDAEIERRIVGGTIGGASFEAWGYVGGFSFWDSSGLHRNGARIGARGSMDLAVTDVPGLKLAVHGAIGYGLPAVQRDASIAVTLVIPFGRGHAPTPEADDRDAMRRRMTARVRKRDDVVTRTLEPVRETTALHAPLHPITEEPVTNVWFVSSGASGPGTMADPADVDHVKAHSTDNDLIVILGGDGAVDTKAGGFALKPGQIVTTSGVSLPFLSPTGRSAAIEFHGARGALTNSDPGSPVLLLADYAAALGLEMSNPDGAGIVGKGVGGVVRVENNALNDISGEALFVSAGNESSRPLHLVVVGNLVESIDHGTSMRVEAPMGSHLSTLDFARNIVADIAGDAFAFEARGSFVESVQVRGNQFRDVRGDAVQLRSEAGAHVARFDLSENEFRDIEGRGMLAFLRSGSSMNARVVQNEAHRVDSSGVRFDVDEHSALSGVLLGNAWEEVGGIGIDVYARLSIAALTVEDNRVHAPNADAAVQLVIDDHAEVIAEVRGNVLRANAFGLYADIARESTFELTFADNEVNDQETEIVADASSTIKKVEP